MTYLDLIFAARPLLHLPIWSVYLVSLHYHLELSAERFSWLDLAALTALSLMGAGAFYLNQIFDYETDEINNKLGFLQRRLLTKEQLWKAAIISSGVSLIIAAWISSTLLLILVTMLLLGFFYSVPPVKLKNRPWWGLFANSIGFGFLVPITVLPDISLHNTGLLGWDTPFYFLVAVASVHILTTIPDVHGDELTGKKTIAVVVPGETCKWLAMALTLLSVYIAFSSGQLALADISIVSAGAILLCIVIPSMPMTRLAAKLPVLLLTFLAGYFFVGYLLFIVALLLLTRIYYARRFGVKYPVIN